MEFTSTVAAPTIGILIRDRIGNDVFGTNSFHVAPIEGVYDPGEVLSVDFDLSLNLGPGTYTLTVAVHSDATHLVDNYDWWDKVIGFEIIPGLEPAFIGSTWLPVTLHVDRRGTMSAGATRGRVPP